MALVISCYLLRCTNWVKNLCSHAAPLKRPMLFGSNSFFCSCSYVYSSHKVKLRGGHLLCIDAMSIVNLFLDHSQAVHSASIHPFINSLFANSPFHCYVLTSIAYTYYVWYWSCLLLWLIVSGYNSKCNPQK